MVFGGAFSSPEEEAEVTRAEIAYENRNYDEAWEQTNALIDKYPESLESVRLLVLIAQDMNRLQEVLERFNPEKAEGWEKVKALYVRGWASILFWQAAPAENFITEADRLAGRDLFELRRALAVMMRMKETTSDSEMLAEAKRLVRDFPDNGASWITLLNTYNFTERRSKAHFRDLDNALSAQQRLAQTWMIAAQMEEGNFWGDQLKMLEILEKGIEEFPNAASLRHKKIMVLRKLGRMDEALALAIEMRDRYPNHGEMIQQTLEIYRDLNRWDDALDALERMTKITHQPNYQLTIPLERAKLFHIMGKHSEAVAELNRLIAESPAERSSRVAARLRNSILSASPDAKVKLLPPIGYLAQRGNYCGPATVSVLFGNLGVQLSQEEIAKKVYTGIVGTPPQVLHHFASLNGLQSSEFVGDQETWKRLIDAGHPILWLQMLGRRGAHYRIVTGYDEFLGEWIMQDPNDYSRIRMDMDSVRDLWPFGQFNRSIVFFHPEQANDPVLASLQATTALKATNWLMYVGTGSNLFVSLFPALPINVAFAAVMAWAVAWLLRLVSYPRRGLKMRTVFLAILGLIAPLNLFIGLFRWSEAVSLLLAFHLALFSLIPILIIVYTTRKILGDFFHPWETVGFTVMVSLVWILLSFIDQDPWQWLVPVLITLIVFPLLILPRLQVRWVENRLAAGDPEGALQKLDRLWSYFSDSFSSQCLKAECLLRLGRYNEFIDVVDSLLVTGELPAKESAGLKLAGVIGRVMNGGTVQDFEAALCPLIKERGASKGVKQLASGMLASAAEQTAADDLKTHLAVASRLAGKPIPGLFNSRQQATRWATTLLLLIMLRAATGSLKRRGLNGEAAGLINRFGAPWVHMIPLLAEVREIEMGRNTPRE